VRALAPAALLVAVASLGVARSATLDQSSWQGASFGMFATYDNDVSRHVVVTVAGSRGRERVLLPEDLTDDAKRLQVIPTTVRAASLAAALLARIDGGPGDTVTVEVWRLVISHDGALRVRVAPLATGSAAR
jgi:hypothetical protein